MSPLTYSCPVLFYMITCCVTVEPYNLLCVPPILFQHFSSLHYKVLILDQNFVYHTLARLHLELCNIFAHILKNAASYVMAMAEIGSACVFF
jgi:hypothetical protein